MYAESMGKADIVVGGATTLLGGILGGVLSGSYQILSERRNRPKLKFAFNSDRDKVEDQWGGDYPFDGINVRVQLSNAGAHSANNCRVYLTKLSRVEPGGEVNTALGDSRQMSWSGYLFEPRQVPRGVNFYIDLARFSKSEANWDLPFLPKFDVDKRLWSHKGTYRFTLIATADNAVSDSFSLDITYKGDWHEVIALQPQANN